MPPRAAAGPCLPAQISVFLLRFDYCHQPDELAKAVSQAVQGDCSDDDAARQGCCAQNSPSRVLSCLKTRPAGIELLHSMACSVRDLGVESIFTRGSAGGDWQQRQHPSDLVLQLTRTPPPAVQHDAAGGGAADAADQSSVECSAYDEQTRHSAECIAAVTARVLRQRGVDEATICDAVRTQQAALLSSWCVLCSSCRRCTAVAQAMKSFCCT